jgi:small GTP-binding protein
MPINAGVEYFKAEEKYRQAKTREEKIAALEEMISTAPKHKGAENLLAQLKQRLAKLKKESSSRAKSKPKFVIKKEGAAQVCIIGVTKSGKSSLLKALTNVDVEVADYEYTTTQPVVGMMDYKGVGIQLVEIPSTFDSDSLSIVRACNLALVLIDGSKEIEEQLSEVVEVMEKSRMDSKKILIAVNKCDIQSQHGALCISAETGEGLEKLKDEIWKRLDLIRVYTKSPDKKRADKPLTLPIGSTVKDAAKSVHKTILKGFRFARIFNDTKYSGQKVGLEYKLSDLDTVEIHAG